MMKQYAVVYEPAKDSTWSAYVPDLPGCVASAPTRDAIRKAICRTIEFHLDGLREQGNAAPEPSAEAEMVRILEPPRDLR